MNISMYPALPILIVDDEENVLTGMEVALRTIQITNIVTCSCSVTAKKLIEERAFELIVLDITMPEVTGEELLSLVVQRQPEVPVVIITGSSDIQMALRCIKKGVFDYLLKPAEQECLLACIKRALSYRELQLENQQLKTHLLNSRLAYPEAFGSIITQNERMRAIFRYIEAVSTSPQPVLITGETGTGKELIARSIHAVMRKKGNFIALDVAALDETMFADTLFGHVSGAFTGAGSIRKGLIEQATGGTLFLDEIGDLSTGMQIRLLRLLQEREYFPIGSDVPKRTNAKIVVATNKDLHEMQENGSFRKDLYYRLMAHHVSLPPLRERLDDLPLLIEHFAAQAAQSMDREKPAIEPTVPGVLATHSFPGNIRELQSIMYDAVSTCTDTILSARSLSHLSALHNTVLSAAALPARDDIPTIKQAVNDLVQRALEATNGNQSRAAKMLGITQQALSKRLKIMSSASSTDL